jgi:integration host factor subunit beta
MIRSELVRRLADAKPELQVNDAECIVTAIFEAISVHVAAGGRVELRGFGSFATRAREARTGRNPRSGELVQVHASRALHFKPGKEMRERLNVI